VFFRYDKFFNSTATVFHAVFSGKEVVVVPATTAISELFAQLRVRIEVVSFSVGVTVSDVLWETTVTYTW
jgi:hypothetical protein